MLCNRQQRFRQGRAGNAQLLPVKNRKLMQQAFSVRGKLHKDLTAVMLAVATHDRPTFDEPIHQLYCAVMTQTEPLRKHSHCRTKLFRQALDGQKQLMLLRFYALRTRCFFTEMEELADGVTERS